MATVTPNYNWPVPTSTDFVKDGADSIKDLGDAIDATVFALPSAAGLTKITSTTFSAVSSASVNNCFSAAYDNYKIIFEQTTQSANALIYFRYRNGGVDRTASDYYNFGQGIAYTGTLNNLLSQQSVGYIGSTWSGNPTATRISLEVFKPFDASIRAMLSGIATGTFSATGESCGHRIGVYYNVANSNDGFTIQPSAGTFTGKITVYGYEI